MFNKTMNSSLQVRTLADKAEFIGDVEKKQIYCEH